MVKRNDLTKKLLLEIFIFGLYFLNSGVCMLKNEYYLFMNTILRSKPKYNLRKMCISQAASRERNNRVWRYESLFIVNTN